MSKQLAPQPAGFTPATIRFLSTCILFLSLLGSGGCGETYQYGCLDDGDCRSGRVCVERICTYPEQGDPGFSLDFLGAQLFQALISGERDDLYAAALSVVDYDRIFDFPDQIQLEGIYFFVTRQLLEDLESMRLEIPLAGLEYIELHPGEFAPLAPGEQRAREALDRLRDNLLVVREPSGRNRYLQVGNIIRVDGRWKVFSLIRPFDPEFVFGDD